MNLSEELDSIYQEAVQKIGSSVSEEDLDKNKNDFIGKKGKLTAVLKNVVSLSIEEKNNRPKSQRTLQKARGFRFRNENFPEKKTFREASGIRIFRRASTSLQSFQRKFTPDYSNSIRD